MKQEDEQKNALDQKAAAGLKGANAAPSGSKLKAGPDSKKVNNLKRPGSPNLSELESSGNESSRKRHKKAATGSVRHSRASTPVQSQWPKKASGAASDGEATGAEMSDGGRSKISKKKLVVGSHGKSTPAGSRAGSPVPGSLQVPSGQYLFVDTFFRATCLFSKFARSAPLPSMPCVASEVQQCSPRANTAIRLSISKPCRELICPLYRPGKRTNHGRGHCRRTCCSSPGHEYWTAAQCIQGSCDRQSWFHLSGQEQFEMGPRQASTDQELIICEDLLQKSLGSRHAQVGCLRNRSPKRLVKSGV